MRRNKNVKLDESLRYLINKMINVLTIRKAEIENLGEMIGYDGNQPFFNSSDPETRVRELSLEIAQCELYRDNPDLLHLFWPFVTRCNSYSAYYLPSIRKNYVHRSLILIVELFAISSLSIWHEDLTESQKTIIIVGMILLLCAFPINCLESRLKPEFKIFAVAREIMNHPQIIATLEDEINDIDNTPSYVRYAIKADSLPSQSLYQRSLSLFSRSGTQVAPDHTENYSLEA